MASDPFLLFPMEPGSSSHHAGAAGWDPRRHPPRPHSNPVLYVTPLRVVAPPGIPPVLPPSFDPFFFCASVRPGLFPYSAASHANAPTRNDFNREGAATNLAEVSGPASRTGDHDRIDAGNGIRKDFWSGAGSGHGKSNRFGNASQACSGVDGTPPTVSIGDERLFVGNQAQDGTKLRHNDIRAGSSFSGNVLAPAPNDGNPSLQTEPVNSCNEKASVLRDLPSVPATIKNDFPSSPSKMINAPSLNIHIERSKTFSSSEPSTDKGGQIETSEAFSGKSAGQDNKRPRRDPKPKRSARPTIDELSDIHGSPLRAVSYTMRLYDALRRNLMHEEETKCQDANKGGRPDLHAGSVINSRGLSVNRSQKLIGQVPGIEVGALFFFRMELSCVGLHGPIQAGIEYITAKESEHNESVAISIISSGGYDAKDDGEELVYTGQGGKGPLVSKQVQDQKLERGNLAMKGSMSLQVPVRVTRGVKDSASPSGKAYTYDGLYHVEECWSEKGKLGFEEFKFRLRRCPGQPELGSAMLKLSNTLKYRPTERDGLCISDITNGQEGVPVCVVNTVDGLSGPPPFEYSTSLQYPPEALLSQQYGPAEGCDCEGVCSSAQACSCFKVNGGSSPYLADGLLVKERGVLHECSSKCTCSLSCKNRLTQRGMIFRLEVFKTEKRGWGLRSWDTIPAGSFICEYTGKFLQSPHSLETRDFVLDLRRVPVNNPVWGDVASYLDSQTMQALLSVSRPEFIIDASKVGNAARFINHSCSPNILVQCVFRDYENSKRAHAMLYAMENIAPFKELTINYGSEPLP